MKITLLSLESQPMASLLTRKPSRQRTGLELSLSYDIIQAHGGRLKVNSETGKGTSFTINIPTNN